MKTANVMIAGTKAIFTRMLTVAALAAAVVLAAPTQANAQVGIGVRIGPAVGYYGPAYRRPVVVAPPVYGYYGGPRVYAPAPYYYNRFGWDHRYDRRFYR